VVNARVVDARGQPLALLSFNDEVGTGSQRFRLTLFGRLIRDAQPAFPLRLQDVEGFLLLPDQFPDRAMLPRRAGVVYSSQRYGLDRFSDAEWQSEERSRYLTEYQNDVDRASQDLAGLGGNGPDTPAALRPGRTRTMRAMRVLSVNVGTARPVQIGGRTVMTAIAKQPQSGPVAIGPMGLAGDEQADPTVHGGLSKAVYAYPSEHLAFWRTVRAQARVAGWDAEVPPGWWART
jgi:hypothetical protein